MTVGYAARQSACDPQRADVAAAQALQPVSVIMPVYNGQRFVAQAIESILSQTHPIFEFIIVNDGSTDQTADIIAQYAARDARIRTLTQPNLDQPVALNHGLREARYKWVAIIDHDDVSMPERLERQLRYLLLHPSVRVLGTYAMQIDEHNLPLTPLELGPVTIDDLRRIKEDNGWISLIHPSVMMHRDTVIAVGGYDPVFGAAADTELWSRIAEEHDVLTLPLPLIHYRVHSRSMSATRFFEQQRALRWIETRQTARRRGAPVPTVAELACGEWGEGSLRHIHVLRRDLKRYLLRRRVISRVEGKRVLPILYLVAAWALTPRQAVKRVGERLVEQ
jgi:glycosyltransferase involved in cell wall biosynthesis